MFLQEDVLPAGVMELECQRGQLVDAGRISQEKPGSHQFLQPLYDGKQTVLACPPSSLSVVPFIWGCLSAVFHGTVTDPAMACEQPLRTLCSSRAVIGKVTHGDVGSCDT